MFVSLPIVLLMAVSAFQAPDDPIENACYQADHSQQAMNRCAGEAYQRADQALNAQWSKVLARYDDPESKKLLLDAQRVWLKYRDAHCQLAALDSRGGSIWLLLNSGCLASLTRRRTQELKELIDGVE